MLAVVRLAIRLIDYKRQKGNCCWKMKEAGIIKGDTKQETSTSDFASLKKRHKSRVSV
jgi:hypothetical protein